VLNPLPTNHPEYLPRFDGENGITAQKHIQAFEDYLNIFEVEDEDVSLRLFALSLQSKAKTRFEALPEASISNLQWCSKLFLDRWMIKDSFLSLIQEYDELKRIPNESVQQFSDRFNQVYLSMPLNIRPPPDLALLQYPRAFDPEMEFRLRERCPSTLKKMQDIAVDVEANLKMREERRKAEQEEKLHSLLQQSEQMMQRIKIRAECLEHQNISVLQEKSSDIHKQTCNKTDDVFIQSYVKEQSPDMLYEYNSFPFFSCLPKYDEYDDDYEPNDQITSTEQSNPTLAGSEDQAQQPEPTDQPAHFSYEVKKESAECFDFSEGALPFCFESFQFIRDNYHDINNQVSVCFDTDHLEESQILAPVALPLDLQPQSTTKYQIEEDSEAAAYDQMIQVDPLHLCFQSSESFEQEEEEQPAQISQVPNEPVCNEWQVSFHVLYDASADKLNDEVNQCSSPLESCEVQYQVVDSLSSPKHNSDPKPLYSSLFQPCNNVHMLQDPFV